jgi:hypothetical protein
VRQIIQVDVESARAGPRASDRDDREDPLETSEVIGIPGVQR